MNDREWVAYLDTLPPELSSLAQHIMERINTIANRERQRAHGEHQDIHQRLDVKRTKITDLRMIVADAVSRIEELEKAAGGGSAT